jgi:glutathione S-transferase
MPCYTLYGSPHSLPTYKVALMLRMSGRPFSFRYVSFQKGMHRSPEFQSLSRWGQVPVLVEDGRAMVQSAAIVEHLSETLNRFRGPDPSARQFVREWLFWDVDALFPAVFGCYAAELDRKNLLPLNIDPNIAAYRRRGAENAFSSLETKLGAAAFLCGDVPTIADLFCLGDAVFAEICGLDLNRWRTIADWTHRLKSLSGFVEPFDLVPMHDAEL